MVIQYVLHRGEMRWTSAPCNDWMPISCSGIINEKLRLECDGLEELLAYYDMTEEQLATRLLQIGYHYDPMSNQFKAHG